MSGLQPNSFKRIHSGLLLDQVLMFLAPAVLALLLVSVIRQLPADTEGLPVDFISCDVSFISLKQILPVLPPLLKAGGRAVVLVKPQFEAGRAALNKNGVVRDPKIHRQVLREIRNAAACAGLVPLAECESPVRGGSGNTEFLLLLEKPVSATA